MSRDIIWAPWRIKYITQVLKKTKGCVFCAILKSARDKENLIVRRTAYSFAVLNIYPYNNGHLLVLPQRHVRDLRQLREEETLDFLSLVNNCTELLDNVLKPDGYNIGMNIGWAAGAGFPGHVHMHIVPRWKGDVNFMPVVGDTKVISQSMSVLHDELIKAVLKTKRKKASKTMKKIS
jgi:ATP adenylyltransferase